MKKSILYALLLVMAFSFCGCSGGNENENKPAQVAQDIPDRVTDNNDSNQENSDPVEVSQEENESADEVQGDTIGTKYLSVFLGSEESDCNLLADLLIDKVPNEMELVKMDVKPGYLNGFQDEITGFNSGVMFSPMIGSIPFVGYVFESDDPETLEQLLKDSADLRWNVCTEADEMVSGINGNLVFFMMCLNEE